MFKYNVYGETVNSEVSINSNDVEHISSVYEMMRNSSEYLRGHISDLDTGEVYCYFFRERDCAGSTTTEWVAG